MRGTRVTFSIVLAVALLIGASAAAATISLPKTGQTKCYSGSTEVPCAGTGQDGEEQRGVAWPSPRFTQTYCDNNGPCADQSKDCDGIWGNNLITDHLTGLQWMGGLVFYPNGYERKFIWEEILDFTQTWTICGGLGGWRVPNIVEILSLSSYGTGDRLPAALGGWSGTTNAGDTESAWVGDTIGGRMIIMASEKKTNQNYATLVRSAGGLVLLPQTGQTISYKSGDDGDLRQGVDLPNPRFTDNLDRTYTDQLTGIRWYKEPESDWWGGMLNRAKSKNAQKYLCSDQWTVPNIFELRSLFDYGQYNPALPSGHPFSLPPEYGSHFFWSSTTDEQHLGSAFTVKRRDALVTSTPTGYQDGYFGLLMVKGTTPLCLYTLTVNKTGSGTGTVTSAPAGINCGTTCAATFAGNTVVTLTATSAQGSVFTGWAGGGCSGTGTCVVTITNHTTVTANFDTAPTSVVLTVAKTGSGTGTVTSAPAGIACGATCSASYNPGTVVTLTATADTGSGFTGWSGGGCSGTGQCVVTVNANMTVTAQFDILKTLTVVKAGTGSGTVTSTPAGIDCGADCSEPYPQGTAVTLIAVASSDSRFTGWSGGGCSGTSTCTVSLNSDTTVTATFTPAYTLTVIKQGSGTGRVTSDPEGINCGIDCSFTFVMFLQVTLTATPDAGFVFSGWSGCDTSTGNTCTVTMTATKFVYATFGTAPTQQSLTVSKAGSGSGTVTSNPPGITCGSDCSESYPKGTSVTLTATPAIGSIFTGWSGGGCSGISTCTVVMNTAVTVTASFTAFRALTITKSGSGSGTVTSIPSGISCGSDCSESYPPGTSVTLTATPAIGSIFTGWSGGGCSSTSTCTLTLSTDITVDAAFSQQGVDPLDTWHERDSGTDENLLAAAYGNSTFVAAGEGGTILTSVNGTSWTPRSTGTPSALMGLAYHNGLFVAVGQDDTILTSPDGTNWTSQTPVSTPQSTYDTSLYSVAYGNDRYLAVGEGSVIATSPNGTSWTLTELPDAVDLYGVAYGNGTFVAIGSDGLILTTTDGSSWQTRTSSTSQNLESVTFGKGLFVAVGDTGTILTSPNGTDWTPRTSGTTNSLWGVSFDHDTFVAVGPYGTILTSTDGSTWKTRESTTSAHLYNVGFGKETFLTLGEYGTILQSDPLGSSSAYTLTVARTGSGTGTVTSSPPGISCGSDCSESYPEGTSVTLTATPAIGSIFTGWSGACSGTGDCIVIMDSNKSVTATFSLQAQFSLTVVKAGTGDGTVTSSPAGISCGSTCSETFQKPTKVKLTAIANPESIFTGWSGGGCSGTKPCMVMMDSAITVTASFDKKVPHLSFSLNSLEFGSVKVGKSRKKTLKIINNGTGDLWVSIGGGGTDFSVAGSTNITVKPKKSYNLAITFKPASTGDKTATLVVLNSNDPDARTLSISLSGTGI